MDPELLANVAGVEPAAELFCLLGTRGELVRQRQQRLRTEDGELHRHRQRIQCGARLAGEDRRTMGRCLGLGEAAIDARERTAPPITSSSPSRPYAMRRQASGRARMTPSVLREEGIVAVQLQPAASHVADGGGHGRVSGGGRQEGGDGGADALTVLHAQQGQVVRNPLCGALAVSTLPDEDVRLMLEGAAIVRIGPFQLGQEQGYLLEPRVGIGPAHEAVVRAGLPFVVAGMELLEVLAAFFLRPGQRDLDEMTHLRRPAPERLDELPERETAGRLRLKLVFMNVLHGARILAAVRRALTLAVPTPDTACDG